MKADFKIVLNDLQLRAFLNSLSITDCKIAIGVLQKRIAEFKHKKFIHQLKRRLITEEFFCLPIEEFNLSKRAAPINVCGNY